MPDTSPAPVLILIHGATGNGRMWDAVRRHLGTRWAVIAPDLPGHAARRDEPFTLAAAVETVAAAVRSVAPRPVVLAGDSLGGYTALAAAAAVPAGQLRGLVLAGCTANMTGSALRQLVRRQWLIGCLAALLGEQRLSRLVAKDLKRAGLSEADVAAQVEAGFNHRVFPQAVAALRGVDFRPRLAAITQPVLIVNGGKDKLFVDQEASFVAVARRATVHRFDGCEHGVSLRRPEAFAQLVDGFMAGLGEA